MGELKTITRPALAPDIQHSLRFGRARLLSALIRAYADLDSSERVLRIVMSHAERRFSSGSLPPNPDNWLRRHCIRMPNTGQVNKRYVLFAKIPCPYSP